MTVTKNIKYPLHFYNFANRKWIEKDDIIQKEIEEVLIRLEENKEETDIIIEHGFGKNIILGLKTNKEYIIYVFDEYRMFVKQRGNNK